MKKNEYRLVRPDFYRLGTLPQDMDGHYVRADSLVEAIDEMRKHYPTGRIAVDFRRDAGGVWKYVNV